MSVCQEMESASGDLGESDEEVSESYLVQVQDQHGNETYFTVVGTFMTQTP